MAIFQTYPLKKEIITVPKHCKQLYNGHIQKRKKKFKSVSEVTIIIHNIIKITNSILKNKFPNKQFPSTSKLGTAKS